MKIYAYYGFHEFVLALGYKGDMIRGGLKEYLSGDDDFKIVYADTGAESLTGERVLRAKDHITEDEFMVTYGDGVSTIDINRLVAFHRNQGSIGTIAGVHPHSKFGVIKVDEKRGLAKHFVQKPVMSDYINGGFMIFNRRAFDYLDKGPIENIFDKLIPQRQLSVYVHKGLWRAVDTYKELQELNEFWQNGRPWAVWES